jgi:stage II sporulation protein D
VRERSLAVKFRVPYPAQYLASILISIAVFSLVLIASISSCSSDGSPLDALSGDKPVYADVLARPIRVLLAQGAGVTVKVTGSASVFSSSGEKVSDVSASTLQFKFKNGKVEFNSAQSNEFTVQSLNGDLGAIGDEYRGKMRIVATSKDILLINVVDVDEYLRGVIPAEMPYTWNIEALKAQAVAARTYAVKRMLVKANDLWDVVATTADQVYRGTKYERSETDRAVAETAGEIATYEGKPIIAYYHSDSGGHTKDGNAPYLKPVPSPSPDSPYANWELSWTLDEFRKLLDSAGKPAGNILDVETTYDPYGRCQSVTFNTAKNSFSMTAHEFRKMVGVMTVRSTKFLLTVDGGVKWTRETVIDKGSKVTIVSSSKERVERAGKLFIANFFKKQPIKNPLKALGKQTTPAVIRVKGSGFGHGTGMSQWGAKYMADNGSTYRDILLHYYTGIEVVQMTTVIEESS